GDTHHFFKRQDFARLDARCPLTGKRLYIGGGGVYPGQKPNSFKKTKIPQAPTPFYGTLHFFLPCLETKSLAIMPVRRCSSQMQTKITWKQAAFNGIVGGRRQRCPALEVRHVIPASSTSRISPSPPFDGVYPGTKSTQGMLFQKGG